MIKYLLFEVGMEVNDDFKELIDYLVIYLELFSYLYFLLGELF